MLREIGIVAGDGSAAREVFRLERIPIGGDDELGLVRLRAIPQRRKRRLNRAGIAGRDMDVVALKHAAGRSDWLVLPFRRRSIVVFLFPKAVRN